jgi:hypothetical protein
MPHPFTIEIFSTTGDPQGIRVIQKTNWSGVGVVFPREKIEEAIKEEHAKRPGVYILVGDLAEETVYIGEADPVDVRLKQHLQKDWSWGVFFVDSHGLGKTEVQFLEAELVRIARETGAAVLMNRNVPSKPNMSRQSQAAATVFLSEMLLILPMIGIKAFSKPKPASSVVSLIENKPHVSTIIQLVQDDTIVIPAKEDGFKNVFLEQNCWYAIRLNAREISKLKYIAAYQVAPISAITHIAEIKEILPYQDSGKYIVNFKSKAVALKNPITLSHGKAGSQPQSPRYTRYEKIIGSSKLHELWV